MARREASDLRVQASFKDVGRRRIALTFQEAQVSEISISPLAETLLAPAILPRSSLNHQVLMFIKELELKFPLRGALTSMGRRRSRRRRRGARIISRFATRTC